MDTYKTISINDTEYYLSNDIYDFDNSFFYGTANNIRNVVNKKNIPKEDYLYAYNKNKQWKLSNKKYCRAKLFLSKEWCIDNVPKFSKNSNIVAEINKLPPLLELDEDQKFTDGENIYDIKIRGDRSIDGCYFSVNDVGKAFGLKQLSKSLANKDTGYELNLHYKIFITKKNRNPDQVKSKNSDQAKSKKIMTRIKYFTYKGLIRCLYVSRCKKAEKFQDWANKILFTHQFGNVEEKTQLASKLLGVHYKSVREVFKTSSTTIPCVYLFTLGTAKNLKGSMKLPEGTKDDTIICKYGMTDNLERRTGEHYRTFKSIKNTNLCLKYYAYIDPQYISKAENYLSDIFSEIGAGIEYNNMDELVGLTVKQLKGIIKKTFIGITNQYAGHAKELIAKIKSLENELILKEQIHKNDMLEKDNIINMLKKDNDLTKVNAENEVMRMKLKLLENNIN